MSKSLGNSIEPQDIIKQSGADILRLWVVDERLHAGDPPQQGDPRARRSRRTGRSATRCGICSANLYDFDPAADRVPRGAARGSRSLHPRALRGGRRSGSCAAYEDYDYGTIFQALNTFTTVDLSAFYADVSKDRLYTFAARSRERRSAQTAMYLMADGLTRLMAPILSFTADELWRFLPGPRARNRCTSRVFPSAAELERARRPGAARALGPAHRPPRAGARRDRAAAQGQADRQLAAGEGRRSPPRDAELALLERYARDLPMLFIVSEVELRPAPTDVEAHAGGDSRASRSSGPAA